jgi:5'(3')-deoxyribonucleotidase
MLNIGLFDLDGSTADYSGQLLADLEKLRGPNEPVISEHNLWKLDDQPHIKRRIKMIKSQPGWWRNLPVIESGMRVFHEAARIGFENQALTKAPQDLPNSWGEKREWSLANFGDVQVIVVSKSKGQIYGKFLFDDHPEFCLQWLAFRPRGLVIMPSTVANAGFTHSQVLRWTGENWSEVQNALVECYNRA